MQQGCIAQAAGPGGRAITYTYDAAGNLTLVSDQAGQTFTFSYDAEHRLTGGIDAEGNPVFTASYDDYDRATSGQGGRAAELQPGVQPGETRPLRLPIRTADRVFSGSTTATA